MEQFFQFTGRSSHGDNGDNGQQQQHSDELLLDREKTYVYSSPRERTIDRCGELPRGAYFACSDLVYYGDHVWMKIRRGAFSNATQASGYVRVEFDFDDQLAPKQRRPTAFHTTSRRFKYLVELPTFPTFLCSRDRVTLSRIRTFHTSSPSSSLSSITTPNTTAHLRQLPPASVFHATERCFNDDFSQLSLKISSPFGFSGWINVSYSQSLQEVEDPRKALPTPVLIQNIAPRTGKWMGELPVRGSPTLQALRLGNLESFRIATAVERKLVKDHVWLRLQDFEGIQGNDDASSNQRTTNDHDETTQAWIIERHANTGERVTVPWGVDSIHDETLHRDEYAERYYRNIYGRRVLPLRKSPRLQSEVVGELAPGTVVVSTRRVLNAHGHVWIRIALSAATSSATTTAATSSAIPQEVTYAYAIQSSAKTNVCMLQEIPPPGKMAPKQFFQVVLKNSCAVQSSSTEENSSSENNKEERTTGVAARSEPSRTAKELFYLKDGAIVGAIGSIYNSEQKTMWLQVLRDELDPEMVENKKLLPHEQRAAQDDTDNQDVATLHQQVVYVPLCYVEPERLHETVLFSLGRALHKAVDPVHQDAERQRTGARVVFTGGRASKLFGSQLMKSSTIELDRSSSTGKKGATMGPVASAAGEDPAQSLKNEINAWQQNTSSTTGVGAAVYAAMERTRMALTACVQRPFEACLQRKTAARMYSQLHQDDAEDEDHERLIRSSTGNRKIHV